MVAFPYSLPILSTLWSFTSFHSLTFIWQEILHLHNWWYKWVACKNKLVISFIGIAWKYDDKFLQTEDLHCREYRFSDIIRTHYPTPQVMMLCETDIPFCLQISTDSFPVEFLLSSRFSCLRHLPKETLYFLSNMGK